MITIITWFELIIAQISQGVNIDIGRKRDSFEETVFGFVINNFINNLCVYWG